MHPMKAIYSKAIAAAVGLALGVATVTPKAEAHHDDWPAIIAGLAIGAIIAKQASRHHKRRHYGYYDQDSYHYAPPPRRYYKKHKRHKRHAKPVRRRYQQHHYPGYYPPRYYEHGAEARTPGTTAHREESSRTP